MCCTAVKLSRGCDGQKTQLTCRGGVRPTQGKAEGDKMAERPAVRGPDVDANVGGALTWDEGCKDGPDASTAAFNSGSGSGSGSSDLERLIRLLTNEDTAQISERQLVVLRQVCKTRQRG